MGEGDSELAGVGGGGVGGGEAVAGEIAGPVEVVKVVGVDVGRSCGDVYGK